MRRREITGTTHNERAMAVDGTHGVGRVLDALSTIDGGVAPSGCRRTTTADTQLSFRLATWCTAVVTAMVRMVKRKANGV